MSALIEHYTTARPCPGCGRRQTPWVNRETGYIVPLTTHEFTCLKVNPDKVPGLSPSVREAFDRAIQWEQRSRNAKNAADLRRATREARVPL